MRILYVAKHASGDNDDEGAIAHALEVLGHSVVKVQESRRQRIDGHQGILRVIQRESMGKPIDFCLFHKWEVVSEIAEVSRHWPCVFWYFDLIANDDDPTLALRMQQRRRWFYDVIPHCTTAFLTDGDWVDRWNSGDPRQRVVFASDDNPTAPRVTEFVDRPLHWLMQGADERYVGMGESIYDKYPQADYPDILFTGTRFHGAKRADHIARLERRYGSRFGVIGENQRRSPRRHGRALADLFATCKVVVAPDGPTTDRYWSNRIYLTAGLGGYLIHPYCAGLEPHYNTAEVRQYRNRDELERMIDYALSCPAEIPTMRMSGLHATKQRNLYRHRVEVLTETVRKLL